MQISYQAGYHLTASDARLHSRTQNLEHLKIFFWGGGGVGRVGDSGCDSKSISRGIRAFQDTFS